ncbi:MAG: transcriptional regulator [Acidimicrobiia bacterium]
MEDESVDEAMGAAIGERLRSIRRQLRWSLHEVETQSEQEFKASVLGAYERGERAISLPRLLRLANLYGVPADQLLPQTRAAMSAPETGTGGFTIDLVALHALEATEREILERFAAAIQRQRQDFNGRMLTIRNADLQFLAAVLGRSVEELNARLLDLGLESAGTGGTG